MTAQMVLLLDILFLQTTPGANNLRRRPLDEEDGGISTPKTPLVMYGTNPHTRE